MSDITMSTGIPEGSVDTETLRGAEVGSNNTGESHVMKRGEKVACPIFSLIHLRAAARRMR